MASEDFTLLAIAVALVLVLLSALAYDAYSRRPRLPGKLKSAGKVALCADEIFGPDGADGRFRDLAHVLEHGELRLLRTSDGTLRDVPPPPESAIKHLHKSGTAHEAELRAHLTQALSADGFDVASFATAVGRLYDMLSFVPAGAVLRDAKCSPKLAAHRFVIIHGEGVLRTLATGHIEARGAPAARAEAALRLTVASPNLCGCGDCAKSSCHVEYVVRSRRGGLLGARAKLPSVEEEMQSAAGGWSVGRL